MLTTLDERISRPKYRALHAPTTRGARHIDEAACRRFQSTVEFAGRKWNAAILLAGVRGARRFSEYRVRGHRHLRSPARTRLRELEAEGLIERHVRATTPVTISYTPSTDGLRLIELAAAAHRVGLERAAR
jgi:DNA-binding HxlR family transcriptional regulator